MSSADQRASTSNGGGGGGGGGGEEEDKDDDPVRDVHALTPPRPLPPPPPPNRARQSDSWETGSNRFSTVSNGSDSLFSTENFRTMSGEFSALVLAGSTIGNAGSEHEGGNTGNSLSRIWEDEVPDQETNPLAIVPDNSTVDHASSLRALANGSSSANGGLTEVMSVQKVKQEETESKISAWQTAKIAKVNNRFKREDAIINGCETEQVQKAHSALKKVERKLEEKRAKAVEKMRNKVAKAHRKAEEKRASAEAKRGTKVAKILETAKLMMAIGRAPTKRSFF